jgi:hypothetical protein
MKTTFMNDEQLLSHRNQLEKDFNRIYRENLNRGIDTPLYEALQYANYLCNKRNLAFKITSN